MPEKIILVCIGSMYRLLNTNSFVYLKTIIVVLHKLVHDRNGLAKSCLTSKGISPELVNNTNES